MSNTTPPIPPQPANSYRVTIVLSAKVRIDTALLAALRAQSEVPELQAISRSKFKDLFKEKRIQLKGHNMRPSSTIAEGTTYIDILGFTARSE